MKSISNNLDAYIAHNCKIDVLLYELLVKWQELKEHPLYGSFVPIAIKYGKIQDSKAQIEFKIIKNYSKIEAPYFQERLINQANSLLFDNIFNSARFVLKNDEKMAENKVLLLKS